MVPGKTLFSGGLLPAFTTIGAAEGCTAVVAAGRLTTAGVGAGVVVAPTRSTKLFSTLDCPESIVIAMVLSSGSSWVSLTSTNPSRFVSLRKYVPVGIS